MERNEIGVGLVGYKFMGRAHSNAYRQVASFFDVDPAPRMAAICGRDEVGVREAADTLGWDSYETDYRKLIARDDIDLVDVVTPGNTHREIVLTALEAGKHVLCEKPLANTLAEAREMLTAGRNAGTVNMVCFNYRRAPAVQLAHKLVEEGRLGEIRHWRATYLQDFIMDPSFPLIWRLQKEVSGSGALGDIGAHIIDLAHFVVGPISEVTGMTETFVEERPLEEASAGGGLSGPLRERRHRDLRGHALRGRPQKPELLRGKRLQRKRRLRPGAHERARSILHGRRARCPGLQDRERDGPGSSVHRGLVAAGPYPRLRAYVRPHHERPDGRYKGGGEP